MHAAMHAANAQRPRTVLLRKRQLAMYVQQCC
ncbi:hypothetical protein PF005_g28245 [Phytophthora fragariae]|uniref:Uncharacterized protein n=1 Tax=Phytophthora fragariae TaxID=53985 RepID=A0A6A3DFK3_9STRA|nr:hypothetical protein PF003_g7777 [Phytophthora fragariae]KAE8918427.1 hypothetical protein PF009_g31258 [Phytophthora fragariae]KAE8962337.1 hypothetical protein PF011_g29433 [Phytophthora fragariae]KAE9058481.1 hypothetical protein PF010_g30980 [Phytophthora fragariae]KAE9060027.1 hypothetical protein PF007_g30750 [Phytophthora fragariae]